LESAAITLPGRRLDSIKLLFGGSDRQQQQRWEAITDVDLARRMHTLVLLQLHFSALVDQDFSDLLKKDTMLRACPLERWLLICDNRNNRAADTFKRLFYKAASSLGMMVAEPETILLNQDRTEDYIRAIKQRMSLRPSLIFVIFPTARSDK
jgi:hypothetical protein